MRLIVLLMLLMFVYVEASKVVLVLGCHINHIQNDRLKVAIDNFKDETVYWYLSGGIKHYLDESNEPEALQMLNMLQDVNDDLKIIDVRAKNTAENFVYFRLWLKDMNINDIYIVTSEFHYNRAKQLLDGIIGDNDYKWILSKMLYGGYRGDERIHSKNINKDIINGLELYHDLID